jgi:hypothetical protein
MKSDGYKTQMTVGNITFSVMPSVIKASSKFKKKDSSKAKSQIGSNSASSRLTQKK